MESCIHAGITQVRYTQKQEPLLSTQELNPRYKLYRHKKKKNQPTIKDYQDLKVKIKGNASQTLPNSNGVIL